MSYREFDALQTIHYRKLERWALERAHFCNAHFRTKETTVPWLPEDFLGGGDREARQRQHSIDTIAVQRENQRLLRMRPGQVPENAPDWLKQFLPKES